MSKASHIEDGIVAWFFYHGGWARKIHVTPIPTRKKIKGKWQITGMRPNPKMVGCADIMACRKSLAYRIEVKTPGDKESIEQKVDRQNFENADGISMIVKSLDDFLGQIKVLKNITESPIINKCEKLKKS